MPKKNMQKNHRKCPLKTSTLFFFFAAFFISIITTSHLSADEVVQQSTPPEKEQAYPEAEDPEPSLLPVLLTPPETPGNVTKQSEIVVKEPVQPDNEDPEPIASPGSPEDVTEQAEIVADKPKSDEKPNKTEDLKKTIDALHKTTIDLFQDAAFKTDNILTPDEGIDPAPLNKSRFSMAIGFKLEDNDGPSLKLDIDLKSDINLPKTKKRLGVFLDTTAPDELPGYEPDEGENNLYAGLRTAIGRSSLPFGTFRVGVKVRVPPVAYTELLFRHHMTWRQLLILPQLKGYWFSDDGFGEIATLTLECLPTANTLANSVTAVKWGETTDGIEWEQSFLFGYRTGRDFKRSPQSISVKCGVFGHKRGTNIIDLYRVSLLYRKAIYKKWLYFEVGPELDFKNENDWDPSPSIRIAVDMLFWRPEDLMD